MAESWKSRRLRDVCQILRNCVGAMENSTFGSGAALVDALHAGAAADRAYKPKLAALRHELAGSAGPPTLVSEIEVKLTDLTKQRVKIDEALAKPKFALKDAKAAGEAIGKAVEAGQAMVALVAKHVSAGDAGSEKEMMGIAEPWARVVKAAVPSVPAGLDSLVEAVIGVGDAASALSQSLQIDFDAKRVKSVLLTTSDRPFGTLVQFNGGRLEAFVQWADPIKAGIVVSTGLTAGLRGDPAMAKLIPGSAPAAKTNRAAITLDTADGLTLGDDGRSRLTLPVAFKVPGIELREFTLSLPEEAKDGENKPQVIDLGAVVAGKLGPIMALIVEGGGVSFVSANDGPFKAQVKHPEGLGFSIKAGPIAGGGYLRYRPPPQDEYGGALQLTIGPVSIAGAGLFQPTTGALVVVMGVRFKPTIQLGFGFSLNGVGGLLASERRVSVDQLTKLLSEGAVSNILLPADPVAAAPKILDQLGAVFPPEPGGFVAGPMLELGWGGDSGLVTAKVGVLIASPDPAVLILGALSVSVPPTEKMGGDGKAIPKIVDLNADLFLAFTPGEFYMRATLRDSKIQGLSVSGDMGMLVRWTGDAAFAISAGGFYPSYRFPPKLADLKRITIKTSPPVSWLKMSVSGYVAVTSNSVQFGGAVNVWAEVGPAKGEASVSLDALFVWSPRFAFAIDFRASVSIKVFGKNVAGAKFRGRLAGTAPWSIYGAASISVLWWDVDFDVGPIEWGDRDGSVLDVVDTLGEVSQALGRDEAWSAVMPAIPDGVTLARPTETAPGLLLQPYSLIEAKQTKVPLEIDIVRTGTYRASVKQIGIVDPRIGGEPAPAFTTVNERFAMGQYLDLTTDEQASRADFEDKVAGLRMSPVNATAVGTVHDAVVQWETFYPRLKKPPVFMPWMLTGDFAGLMLNAGAAARARRKVGNPYLSPAKVAKVKVADPAMMVVVPMDKTGAAQAAPVAASMAVAQVTASKNQGTAMQVVALGLAA